MLRWQAAASAAAGVALSLGAAGCAGSAEAANQAPAMQASTGYVPLPVTPGKTVGYLAIRNNARHADRLVAVRTSAGGRVSFVEPARGSDAMITVPAITIPAGATIRLVPDGPHLLISGAGPMRSGKDITLTLVFARASSLSVQAYVNNPANRDSNYLFN